MRALYLKAFFVSSINSCYFLTKQVELVECLHDALVPLIAVCCVIWMFGASASASLLFSDGTKQPAHKMTLFGLEKDTITPSYIALRLTLGWLIVKKRHAYNIARLINRWAIRPRHCPPPLSPRHGP